MRRSTPTEPLAALGRHLLWLLPLAAALNALLDVPAMQGVTAPAIGPIERSAIFALSTLVVALIGLGLLGLLGRAWPTALVLIVLALIATFANHQKIRFRFEPMTAGDIAFVTQIPFLLTIVPGGDLLWFAVIVLLLATVLVLTYRLTRSRAAAVPHMPLGLPIRFALVLAALAGVSYAASFNHEGNLLRRTYEAAGADWLGWQQGPNYERHGFVAGVLHSATNRLMDEPPGYSTAVMNRIANKYERRAAELNKGTTDVRPNIVVVLSESFTDPLQLRAHRVHRDPIPRTRAVMDETTSGQLVTTQYGGGTANVEFEVLTGLSKVLFAPQVNTPFHQVLPDHDDFPSAAQMFERRGYSTLGIHPFDPGMYLRGDAYATMGFDRFLDQDDVPETSNSPYRFRSDAASYQATLDALERQEQPMFISLVTIQNHVPYRGAYRDPIPVEGPGTAEELEEFSHYLRGLEHSDQAFQAFLDDLEDLDESTTVAFYGDHHPGVWSPQTRVTEPPDVLTRTPFLIWSNREDPRTAERTVLSAQYLLPLTIEHGGLPIPPLYALLHDLRREISVLEPGLMLDADGQELDPQELPANARLLLREYRLVQYDLSVGQRLTADRMIALDP